MSKVQNLNKLNYNIKWIFVTINMEDAFQSYFPGRDICHFFHIKIKNLLAI